MTAPPGAIAAYDLDDYGTGPILDDGSIWLHGHLPDDEARGEADSIVSEYAYDRWPASVERAGKVTRTHARCVPLLDDGEWRTSVRESAPGRGAFPVTIITLTQRDNPTQAPAGGAGEADGEVKA